MAQFTRPQAHSIFTLVLAGVLALGLSRTGMADPWMAFMADTGWFSPGNKTEAYPHVGVSALW